MARGGAVNAWRRADHGDLPERGSLIQAVVYRADDEASVTLYPKMRADVVMNSGHGALVLGPILSTEPIPDLPGRPDDIIGRRGFFWRPYVDVG